MKRACCKVFQRLKKEVSKFHGAGEVTVFQLLKGKAECNLVQEG